MRDGSNGGSSAWRPIVFAALALLIASGVVYKLLPEDAAPEPSSPGTTSTPDASTESNGARPTVIFIVLDMVRWDHTSLCGYTRPTTPTLEGLRSLGTFATTCRAYTPGTWTLPSHASYFTGEEVPVHGADCLLNPEGADSVSLWGDAVRPLGEGLPTLAEGFAEQGYETLLVSGNPVVSKWSATGLHRGFELVSASRQFGDLYGDELVAALARTLDARKRPDAPLFLFVNIADAHHPWLEIPGGVDWVPPRPFLDNRPRLPENEYPRFLKGEMTAEERAAFLERATDSYDWAVSRADDTLGKVIRALKARGYLDGPRRLVITSDHGEFLGEHDLLSHGIFVYEPNARVPLLFHAADADGPRPPLDLGSGPLSALTAFDLVAAGALPERPRPVRAAGYPDGIMSKVFGDRLRFTTAAAWSNDEKLLYLNGDLRLADLSSDPGETSAAPLPEDHPLRDGFEGFTKQVERTAERRTEPTPEMIEALRKLGYVE